MANTSLVNVNFASTDAQKLILILMVVLVVAVTVEKLGGAKSSGSFVSTFVGAFILGLMLEAISYILPEFAVGIALVAVVSVLLSKGQAFWEDIGTATSGKKATNPLPPPVPGTQIGVPSLGGQTNG